MTLKPPLVPRSKRALWHLVRSQALNLNLSEMPWTRYAMDPSLVRRVSKGELKLKLATVTPAADFDILTQGFLCATNRSWAQWQHAGHGVGSLWQVDPQLRGGVLRLVSAPEALALGIEPLTELVDAGADWVL